MQNEPEVAFETDANAFTQATQLNYLATFQSCNWWRRSSQQERRGNLHAFERLIQNSLLERFDVDNDVRQFRHWFGKSSGSERSLTSLHETSIRFNWETDPRIHTKPHG